MAGPGDEQFANRSRRLRCRIEDLRGSQSSPGGIEPTNDEDPAVGEHRRGMRGAWNNKWSEFLDLRGS